MALLKKTRLSVLLGSAHKLVCEDTHCAQAHAHTHTHTHTHTQIAKEGPIEETDSYEPINYFYFGKRGEVFQVWVFRDSWERVCVCVCACVCVCVCVCFREPFGTPVRWINEDARTSASLCTRTCISSVYR